MIEARHTSHSGAISKSGGKLATSTKPLVSLIARLSNDAMRVARDSTNPSRSESGNDRLTYPYNSAKIARDVVGPQKHFQCASASHQTRQPCHWTTSRHHTSPNFKMRQYCFLATGETHVAGQGKFASVTGRAPSDGRDRDNRGTAQAHEQVVERPEPIRPRRQGCRVLRSRHEVVVSHKEPGNRAVKDDRSEERRVGKESK